MNPIPAPGDGEIKVAILDDYIGIAKEMADWGRLPERVKLHFFRSHIRDVDELVAALADFDVVCAMRERTAFPDTVLSRLPRLRLIVSASRHNASIDYESASRNGILVCGTERYTHSTPEMTWTLICAVARQVCREDRSMKSGGWQTAVGLDLNGSTIGIVGLGAIGERIAEFARVFGMNVVAWSQNLTDERASECNARRVTKDELFRSADIVSINLRLSERTRGIVGARELGLMKPTAYLVNTSRGPIVDETALLKALQEKSIAGAALDVYGVEPLPADNPFRMLDNVILTPHSSYATKNTFKAFYGGMVSGIEAWLAGKPINIQGQTPGAG